VTDNPDLSFGGNQRGSQTFRMTLEEVNRHSPCTLDHFYMLSGGASVFELPGGWTQSHTDQLALEGPINLLWYSAKGLIPVSYEEAKATLTRVHGAETTKVIRRAFAAGASPKSVCSFAQSPSPAGK